MTAVRELLFQVTLALSGVVLGVFFIFLAAHLSGAAASRVRAKTRKRVLDLLCGYLLEEVPLRRLAFRRRHRPVAIEGFGFVIASITGRMQERMQRAFQALGLLEPLLGWLDSPLRGRRMRACHLLGLIKSGGMTGLVRALQDRDARVVCAAVIALGETGYPSTVPTLLDLFSRCSYPHAWLIAAVLPSFGSESSPYLKPLLQPGRLSPEKLVLLLKVVAEFKAAGSLEDLDRIYRTSGNLDVRISALNAIGKINDLAAVKTMFDALRSDQWQLRATACRIVGEMSLKGAVHRLLPLITDHSWHVRRNAVTALASLGRLGVTALVSSLDADDRYARDMIVRVLEERGIIENAVADLVNPSAGRRAEVRNMVVLLLDRGYREYLCSLCADSEALERLIGEKVHD
jgi:HEAT repeat protein